VRVRTYEKRVTGMQPLHIYKTMRIFIIDCFFHIIVQEFFLRKLDWPKEYTEEKVGSRLFLIFLYNLERFVSVQV
jgi:hypothetical protein